MLRKALAMDLLNINAASAPHGVALNPRLERLLRACPSPQPEEVLRMALAEADFEDQRVARALLGPAPGDAASREEEKDRQGPIGGPLHTAYPSDCWRLRRAG